MKIEPKALLFDMDGVLVDSFQTWLDSLNHSLESLDYPILSDKEFREKYWGHDLFDTLQKMQVSSEVGTVCNKVYTKFLDKTVIYPNTKKVLDKLKNYPKSLITNTPKNCVDKILKKFNLNKYFKVVLTSDDVKRGKPDPELVLKSCNFLGVKPKEVVLIGDTISDVKAGRLAGCRVIGINVDADITINNIVELLDILVI